MLTLDLSKIQASSESSHTDGHMQVSSYASHTWFGGLFHSSVSAAQGGLCSNPHPLQNTSMVSSLQVMLFLARTSSRAGCKGWLKWG